MKFCENCGNPCDDTAAFCENCGGKFAENAASSSETHTNACNEPETEGNPNPFYKPSPNGNPDAYGSSNAFGGQTAESTPEFFGNTGNSDGRLNGYYPSSSASPYGRENFSGGNAYAYNSERGIRRKKRCSSKTVKRIAGILAALFILSGVMFYIIGSINPSEKTFSKSGLSITLNSNFVENDIVSVTSSFLSDEVLVTCIKEEYTLLEAYGYTSASSLEEYALLVIENNSFSCKPYTADGLTCFEYSAATNGKNYSYYSVAVKGSDALWLVQFCCESKNYASYISDFTAWAKTIDAGTPPVIPDATAENNATQNIDYTDEEVISLIKTASFKNYPNILIDDAIDSFFEEPSWTRGETDGITYVYMNGGASYGDVPADVQIEFALDFEDSSFVITQIFIKCDDGSEETVTDENDIETIIGTVCAG